MRPDRRLLLALALWAALGALPSVDRAWLGPWVAAGAALLAVLAADALAVRALALPSARREVASGLPLGVPSKVSLSFENRGRRPLPLVVFDHPPASFTVSGLPCALTVPAAGGAAFDYELVPHQRGNARFEPLEIELASPLGFWLRRARLGVAETLRVLPNFRPLVGFATLAVEDRLARMGIRRRQRRGEGRDFRELRDYQEGDGIRQVDWKASSRRQKLIVRQFHDETDQRVVLLLDCGRRMRAQEAELVHFDHALTGVLLLGYAALRYGDAVGLLSFGGGHRWVAPRPGPAAMSAILEAVYDLETTPEPPDYLAAAVRLAQLERRRALVVLISNLRDEDSAELLPAVELLRRRHLVLVASLRETALSTALGESLERPADAFFVAACQRYLEARERTHRDLRSLGIATLDVEPQQLPVAMVNRYLEIKRAGAL